MAILEQITEGWTKELEAFTLKLDDTPQSLAGITVTLVLSDNQGRLVASPGSIRKDSDQTGDGKGKVYWKPAATLKADLSPYTIRWKAVDGAEDVVFYPDGEADSIEVFKP